MQCAICVLCDYNPWINCIKLLVFGYYGSSRRGNLLATLHEQIYSGDLLLQHCDKIYTIVATLLQICEKRFPMEDRVMQICEKEFPIEERLSQECEKKLLIAERWLQSCETELLIA